MSPRPLDLEAQQPPQIEVPGVGNLEQSHRGLGILNNEQYVGRIKPAAMASVRFDISRSSFSARLLWSTRLGFALAARRQRASTSAIAATAPPVGRVMPRVAERCKAMLRRLHAALAQDSERARAALQDVIGGAVTLQPDMSRKFLWAEYEMKTAALLGLAGGGESVIMVAGAQFFNYRR